MYLKKKKKEEFFLREIQAKWIDKKLFSISFFFLLSFEKVDDGLLY